MGTYLLSLTLHSHAGAPISVLSTYAQQSEQTFPISTESIFGEESLPQIAYTRLQPKPPGVGKGTYYTYKSGDTTTKAETASPGLIYALFLLQFDHLRYRRPISRRARKLSAVC
jgi:hypothetical protein